MPAPRRVLALLIACLVLATAAAHPAAAIGFESFGPAGEYIGGDPDWPRGVEDVLRHSSRVYLWDVNGNMASYYDGDVAVVNELLELFSKIELSEHRVVIRPGRPTRKSFHDVLTPYVVEFELPGGLAIHFIQQYAATGLYYSAPRLIVHLDEALAEHLDELTIPENVTLDEFVVRVEDALTYAYDDDARLRHRAIEALADAADPSGASVKALLRASADESESIRAAGVRGMEALATAQDPTQNSLRARLSEFVRNHPQYARTLGPDELLAELREADERYAAGFTAHGTLVEPALTGPGRLVAWTLTMGDGRLVLSQRDVEDEDHPPAPGRFEYTIYAGPQRMGALHGYRTWVDGKLSEMTPQASFEPVGETYDLLIGRVLWPLGRGYGRRLTAITAVKTKPGGLLHATAESEHAGLVMRWELEIDPAADFLVRRATAYRRDGVEPEYIVEAAGVLAVAGRTANHISQWAEGAAAAATSVAVESLSAEAAAALIHDTEARLEKTPGIGQ